LVDSIGLWEKKAFLLDVEKEIKIDSVTVANGGTVKIRQNQESFEVPISQGTWNRMTIRIPEKGEASWSRRKRGDLLLDIKLRL
jgi:DnaJ-class molecular chaperone